jgi:NADPH:quinone reductase-like Zn-dependent oxidoreductase
VGWAATQLARSVGPVTIFGTCSPGKHDAVRENGVTYPLNHDSYDKELLKQSPDGVDILIDNMAGSAFSKNQCLLKPLGRIVLIGREMDQKDSLMRDEEGEVDSKGFSLLVGHRDGELHPGGLCSLVREKW